MRRTGDWDMTNGTKNMENAKYLRSAKLESMSKPSVCCSVYPIIRRALNVIKNKINLNRIQWILSEAPQDLLLQINFENDIKVPIIH